MSWKTPENYSFTRYLEAKANVDERALNGHVWRALVENLPAQSFDKPLRVLEAGAGIGTMAERMVRRGLLKYATYTAIDIEKENTIHAQRILPEWSSRCGFGLSPGQNGHWTMADNGKCIDICFRNEDFLGFAARERRRWDLVIASAFLDLVDVPTALPSMLNLLDEGGLFYFTINFDGLTAMEPAIDPGLDRLIFGLYHRSMDERIVNGKPSGNSRAGRSLFSYLNARGAHILAAGGSDWVVFPGRDGYSDDEAYFLHFIVHFIHGALTGKRELDPGRFERWIAERHRQIERGELVYIAHQLDLVGTARND